MKLASVKIKDTIVLALDYSDTHLLLLENLYADMQALIADAADAQEAIKERIASTASDSELIVDKSDIDWMPPLLNPGKVCGVAMNNSASNSRKIKAPDHPAFFLKPASCLIGHKQDLEIRSYYGSVHPEPELAVVIGRQCRDCLPEDAMDKVFGYSIFDDITGNGMRAEDLFHYYALYPNKDDADKIEKVEQHLSYATRYKGTDNFGILGPWIVTADEIDDPDNLNVSCSINGEAIARDNTKYYNYKVAEIISFLSKFLTLNPGDVVSMGTAFKPGSTRKSIHHANLQKVSGPIEVCIEGLGRQETPVSLVEKELGRWKLK